MLQNAIIFWEKFVSGNKCLFYVGESNSKLAWWSFGPPLFLFPPRPFFLQSLNRRLKTRRRKKRRIKYCRSEEKEREEEEILHLRLIGGKGGQWLLDPGDCQSFPLPYCLQFLLQGRLPFLPTCDGILKSCFAGNRGRSVSMFCWVSRM